MTETGCSSESVMPGWEWSAPLIEEHVGLRQMAQTELCGHYVFMYIVNTVVTDERWTKHENTNF